MDNAATFVPPMAPEQWTTTLTRTSREPTLMAELSDKALERAKQFSWDNTVKKTWQVLLG
jgi:hypothetical protein